MNTPNEDHAATYCPEDNKLRLYVGRVPREEYLELRKEGWTSTPKQDCDFAATWTPARQDRALAYAGEIDDEDQSPADRAADRAERFAGYRDKRTAEATGHADAYDAGPAAHGFQDKGKAAKAADKHDRQAAKALTQWDKAEYWTRRTAGVIANALYLSAPPVRMGRIKKLQTNLRRYEASPDYYGRWVPHTRNRIAYEEAMLEAVGGRAALVEMEKGGTYNGQLITRVIKSNASGEVTSLKTYNGTRAFHVDIERDAAGGYEPPTEETRAQLAQFEKDRAADSRERNKGKPKLLNPSKDEAEKLQKAWNEDARRRYGERCGADQDPLALTQAQYSAHSKGTYARLKTIEIRQGGNEQATHYGRYKPTDATPTLCKVRKAPGKSDGSGFGSIYNAGRVVYITDKPAKPLPADVWQPCPILTAREEVTPEALHSLVAAIWSVDELTDEQKATQEKATLAGYLAENGHPTRLGDEHQNKHTAKLAKEANDAHLARPNQ